MAALPGGGFGVAFSNTQHADGTPDLNSLNVTYVPVSANGTFGLGVAVADFNVGAGHDSVGIPAIATLSTGRQVVVFENLFTPGVDDDIYLNVVNSDGTTTQFPATSPLAIAANANMQTMATVAAIGNKALVAFQDSALGIVGGMFDGASNTFGTQFTIADQHVRLGRSKIAALDDHRYVIVYDDLNDVFARSMNSTAGTLSPELMMDQPSAAVGYASAQVATTADDGFIAEWTSDNTSTNDFNVVARRFNSDGVAMGQQFTLNTLTDGTQFAGSVAVSGANAFFTWTEQASRPADPSPGSVRGKVMTLTTPPDFNDNGIGDILWRSDGGQLALWDMSRSGAIAGSGFPTIGGMPVAPDASWNVAAISDFSGDGRSDVLWRNTSGQTVLWTMNGSTITGSASPTVAGTAVNPDPSWSVAGAGDFNGDGASDILWRSASGALVLWSMNGTSIIGSEYVNYGGTPVTPNPSWSMAGIGDFDGDRLSDILWRGPSGELALWTMNGSSINHNEIVTFAGVAISPDPSWTVAGIGDFDADGNADLLWRNSNGSLVAWLMNGSTIAGSGIVAANGAAVEPDPSWHVVEIGDFNGDARTDILWRNDNGQVAEWLMKGTAIIASVTPTAGGIPIAPDVSWHTQAKPTDFA